MKLFEVLDVYDKALRKLLLAVSEAFPYKIERVGNTYDAKSPDGRVLITVYISGVNVRVDVYLNRDDFLNVDSVVYKQLNDFHDALFKLTHHPTQPLKLVTIDDHKFDRRYSRLMPAWDLISPYQEP